MPNNRNAMLGRLHQLKKLQNLDDETYRDKLEQLTGKRSAADLNDDELSLCLNNFHVKQSARVLPHHAKIKALYIAAYNLGLLADGADRALDTFVERQTGKQRLTFVTPSEAKSVTEALKAMLGREGVAFPAGDVDGMEARRSLLKAQWARLHALRAIRNGSDAGLYEFVSNHYLHFSGALINMKRQDLDACARELGRWIRRVKARKPESQKAGNAA